MTSINLFIGVWLLLATTVYGQGAGFQLEAQPASQGTPPLSGGNGDQDAVFLAPNSNAAQNGGILPDSNDADESDAEDRSSASFGPVTSPFFFMCQYPRQGEAFGVEGQDDLSVKVEFVGTTLPDQGYQPQTVYELAVTSNVMFDGFMITGIHALAKESSETSYVHLPASLHGGASEGLVCAVVHSHISRKPRPSLAFLWLSPPAGTGCVAFLAQGSLGEQVLFKDLNVLEICEKDGAPAQLRAPSSGLSGRDQPGFVFRDDFEGHKLDENIWTELRGGRVSGGQRSSISFTEADSGLSSVPLDLSKGRTLQFTLSGGPCTGASKVQLVLGSALAEGQAGEFIPVQGPTRYINHGPVVSAYHGSGQGPVEAYETGVQADDPVAELVKATECSSWEEVHSYSPDASSEVHVQTLPLRFRRKGVCVGWRTVSHDPNATTCWSLDNVAVSTYDASPNPVFEDFDPVNPANWLFFPGSKVKEACGSEGNSLVFEGEGGPSWVTTRLLDLSVAPPPEDVLLYHDFAEEVPEGWEVTDKASASCDSEKVLVMASEGKRQVCTPFFDARKVGTVKVQMQLGECYVTHSQKVNVEVYAEHGSARSLLRHYLLTWAWDTYTIPVQKEHQLHHTRFCVEQSNTASADADVWLMKDIRVLPWLPTEPQHFFQARVNLECGEDAREVAQVDVETSSDGGRSWSSLHRRCLPGNCNGAHSALTSVLTAHSVDSWGLVTLPLPYASLTPHTRLRVKQVAGDGDAGSVWAIDNVFIGYCPKGCSGRGLCQPGGRCKCEYGYSGSACEEFERENPLYVSEPFTTAIGDSANILQVKGGKTSYGCGVVGAGPAAVFRYPGRRALTTVDVNTTHAHFLQFHFVAGTVSDVGKCPGPDDPSESVYVHYSCDGGVTWHLLRTLHASQHKEPSHISLDLPPRSRGPGCRFQIWQERHSGAGRDIWAVDDFTITSQLFNNIELDFSDGSAANNSLRFHLGEIGRGMCGNDSVLMFRDVIASGASRFVETKSIGVGPSYMMQFDLAIGCDDPTQPREADSKLMLEYSLNHGLTWQLVQRPCTPSTPGCLNHFTRGTVYFSSEFSRWKRVTIRLPRHTWSLTTRLRLRQDVESDVGEAWAVDNLYIGRQCPGLCSGHGRCTSEGCSCDDDYHGYKCLPLHKLHRKIDASFDEEDDIEKYELHVVGGNLATRDEGCGNVVASNSLYFGAPGLRQLETDDLNAENLEIIQFILVVGGGSGGACNPEDIETMSAGSVVVEYSTDGGIEWTLLQELLPSLYRTPKLFRAKLEDEVVKGDSGVVRFRVWQPTHYGKNQWALDNLKIIPDLQVSTIQADFAPNSMLASPWLTVTGHHQRHYCGSEEEVQVMDGEEPIREAVTNTLTLDQDDIISFQISVGCNANEVNPEGSPVLLQYSKDGGVAWSLVHEGCSTSALHCDQPSEPSIYRPAHHGPWTRVLIPVDHRLAQGSVQLRWMQENPGETDVGHFALRQLYIGPPCPYLCHGHGICTAAGLCKCDKGYNGTYCGILPERNRPWMRDDFEDERMSASWERAEGAAVGLGCGPHHSGHALVFSAAGPRFATTAELDTRSIKYLVFHLQIGSSVPGGRCRAGQVPRDNVVLEHSPDNGQTWKLLQQFEASDTANRRDPFFIPLSDEARTRQTKFRWWQGYDGMLLSDSPYPEDRAEWHLDNVMVMANETLPVSLYDSFDGNSTGHDPWFLMAGAAPTPACGRDHPVLLFSGQTANKFAETWDFRGSGATVVQFDIQVGCDGFAPNTQVDLQYSIDHGKTWNLVRDLCAPPQVDCASFHLPTSFSSNTNPEWTRVTTTLPDVVVGERTRLRLVEAGQEGRGVRDVSWAVDNVFVGDTCPWMCSGHGYCQEGKCLCDEDYFGAYCVPARVLPCELLDTFDRGSLAPELWGSSHGAEVSQRCHVLVSKAALVFFQDGVRQATTTDLDMTGGQYVQFTIMMGCEAPRGSRAKRSATLLEDPLSSPSSSSASASSSSSDQPNRTYGVLLQYSITGGITWKLLKEIHFTPLDSPAFVSVNLRDFPEAMSNATRFRLWQPRHEGLMSQTWAVDNVLIGGTPISPNVLFEDFQKQTPTADAWVDGPGGAVDDMCKEKRGEQSFVFGNQEGEHALYSRDLSVGPDTVLQYDIRVGCGDVTAKEHSVSVEYTLDYGLTWNTVRPASSVHHSSPDCLHELRTPTVHYPNAAPAGSWTRMVVPLNDLQMCGTARFRWYQGYYGARETSVPWAVDNIYVGPACFDHCGGHGSCLNGELCECDQNYVGNCTCNLDVDNPQTLMHSFEGASLADDFLRWSGSEVSRFCGVITGDSLVFSQQGERMLVTMDLDLVHGGVVQFYIRFGCTPEDMDSEDSPVLLQFSTDGGITWTLLAELGPETGVRGAIPHTQHVTLNLPETSKSNATRLRWWQPSPDGSFKDMWSIDEVYISSLARELPAFTDLDTGAEWLLRPGSVMENVCGQGHTSLHFNGREGFRFAETPDILLNEHSFIQFTLAMGCKETGACYDVEVEYSIDHGSTWWPVKDHCYPSDPDCIEYWPASHLKSDLYAAPTQVTMLVPPRAWSERTRVRFLQREGWRQQHTWSLSHVYVGDECYHKCSSRGFCDAGVCQCQQGWTGNSCENSEHPLPKFLAEDFDGTVAPSKWRRAVGSLLTDHCGPVASGQALHLLGGCSRYLETTDLDLREALFVQFDLRTGCLDPVVGREAGGDHSVLVQMSCDAGVSWKTVKKLLLIYQQPTYVWLQIPEDLRCLGARVRWWQPKPEERNRYDWALDAVVVGGQVTPPDALTYVHPDELVPPMWLRRYNGRPDTYCESDLPMYVMMSTASEPAVLQTSDIQVGVNHSISFQIAIGCGATWDNQVEPVRLEYSVDFGNSWHLVREMCYPGNTSCQEVADASIYYAPLHWHRYVYPLAHVGPAKYVRFRWLQAPSPDVTGSHKWSLRDVYIGKSCLRHCLGRGSCLRGVCRCDVGYAGDHCQHVIVDNIPFIRDEFQERSFQRRHFQQVQGGLISEGCGGLEVPPAATFQGAHTRQLLTRPVDTRSGKFVYFVAQIGSAHGQGVCVRASHRHHNVFLQYSIDGGIRWHLLRELDHEMYIKPREDYIVIPNHARSPATIFRFWQPRLPSPPPAWSVDDLYIGGSEISAASLIDRFEEEPMISEWLFAPHSEAHRDYCSSGTNGSLVWGPESPGRRAITTQELIITEGHVLQFKISVGCGAPEQECRSNPGVRLEYSRDGGVSGWDLVRDLCLPGTSPDPDCLPYTFHAQSVYYPDTHSRWTRVTIPLPEKTWASTTQLRWVQEVSGQGSKVTPWSLDDVYVGEACPDLCNGHGDCAEGICDCDQGYEGESCDMAPSRSTPLPTSLVDGFEGGVGANWQVVSGGGVGLGCNSLAPYGHGKHLYFSGCGTRQAISTEMDTRRASKLMFVLRIGSHDNTPSCRVDLSDPQRSLDKGVILQYSSDNGITWTTLNVHDPLDFRKPRRVAYSLPSDARSYGVQLRWWQPDHDGASTDQWAIDNVEIVLAQRKDTSKYNSKGLHDSL